MKSPRQSWIRQLVTGGAIVMALIGIQATAAEAQSRGTLQVSATVVDSDDAFRALSAARAAVRPAAGQATASGQNAVPTVARVAVARRPRAVVVTIDYSRN
jgi:hypothetical protein